MRRATGTGAITTLDKDGLGTLVVKTANQQCRTRSLSLSLPTAASTSSAKLSVAELQDFADNGSEVMKALAGSEPEIEVRVTIQGKTTANKTLNTVKKDWRF
jgi:hypothetical protein